jgi:competence protein ComEC
MMILFAFIALALFFRLSKGKFIAGLSLLMLAIFINFFSVREDKSWQVSVLDVGHGLAIVIEKNNHVFIYDTGASYPSGFNMADAAILPYLAHQGYQSIDGVIISHNDNDHAGGLRHLRAKIPIERVIANDSKLNPDSECLSGQNFSWQGLEFEVLSPMQAHGDKNDDSCVVIISDGIHRVLLPGDISVKQERRLLSVASIRNKLSSDLLIVPHHGSKSSSSRQFLTAVSPHYAVFSAGYLNRWHMPTDKISARYNAFNITTFNTAELGMVTFKFSPKYTRKQAAKAVKKNIEVSNYSQDMRPYWFVN